MATRNQDGSVTLRTTGRLAYTPSGNGTALAKSPYARPTQSGPAYRVSVSGRKPVDRSAYR